MCILDREISLFRDIFIWRRRPEGLQGFDIICKNICAHGDNEYGPFRIISVTMSNAVLHIENKEQQHHVSTW